MVWNFDDYELDESIISPKPPEEPAVDFRLADYGEGPEFPETQEQIFPEQVGFEQQPSAPGPVETTPSIFPEFTPEQEFPSAFGDVPVGEEPFFAPRGEEVSTLGYIDRYDGKIWEDVIIPTPARAAAQVVGGAGGGMEFVGDVTGIESLQETGKYLHKQSEEVEAQINIDHPLEEGSWSQAAAGALSSIYMQGPFMAMGKLASGIKAASNISLAGISGVVAGKTYGKRREAGSSVTESALSGAWDGMAEFLTEKLPMDALMAIVKPANKAAGGSVFGKIGKYFVGEFGGESAATLLQDANEKFMADPDLSTSQRIDKLKEYVNSGELKNNWIQTMKTVAIQSPLMMLGANTVRALTPAGVKPEKIDIHNRFTEHKIEELVAKRKAELTAKKDLSKREQAELAELDSSTIPELAKTYGLGIDQRPEATKANDRQRIVAALEQASTPAEINGVINGIHPADAEWVRDRFMPIVAGQENLIVKDGEIIQDDITEESPFATLEEVAAETAITPEAPFAPEEEITPTLQPEVVEREEPAISDREAAIFEAEAKLERYDPEAPKAPPIVLKGPRTAEEIAKVFEGVTNEEAEILADERLDQSIAEEIANEIALERVAERDVRQEALEAAFESGVITEEEFKTKQAEGIARIERKKEAEFVKVEAEEAELVAEREKVLPEEDSEALAAIISSMQAAPAELTEKRRQDFEYRMAGRLKGKEALPGADKANQFLEGHDNAKRLQITYDGLHGEDSAMFTFQGGLMAGGTFTADLNEDGTVNEESFDNKHLAVIESFKEEIIALDSKEDVLTKMERMVFDADFVKYIDEEVARARESKVTPDQQIQLTEERLRQPDIVGDRELTEQPVRDEGVGVRPEERRRESEVTEALPFDEVAAEVEKEPEAPAVTPEVTPEEEPLFAEEPTTPTTPKSTTTELEAQLDKDLGKRGRANLKLEVVQTVDEGMRRVAVGAKQAADPKTKGIYNPRTGKSYLIANNVSVGESWPYALHEGMHKEKEEKGWEGVFKDKKLMADIEAKRNDLSWRTAKSRAKGNPKLTVKFYMADPLNKNEKLWNEINVKRNSAGWSGVFGKQSSRIMSDIDGKLQKAHSAWDAAEKKAIAAGVAPEDVQEQTLENFKADNDESIVSWYEAEQKAIDVDTPTESVREEAIAYYLSNNANRNQSLWRRIVNAIKEWATRMGIKREITDSDIVAIAEYSIQRAARKGEPFGAGIMELAQDINLLFAKGEAVSQEHLADALKDKTLTNKEKQVALLHYIDGMGLTKLERQDLIFKIVSLGRPAKGKEGKYFSGALGILSDHIQDEVKQRRASIRNIRDYLELTDDDLRKIDKRDVRLMGKDEFQEFKDNIYQKAVELAEHKQKKLELLNLIYTRRLQKVDNLQKALELPSISKMSQKQLKEFFDILSQYEKDDTFMSVRQLQRVDLVPNLEGIKTWREAKEKIAEETGMSVEDLSEIEFSWRDDYRWDATLYERDPFYKLLVGETTDLVLGAQISYHELEQEYNRLAKLSEKSRKLGPIEKLIPQDKQLFEYMGTQPGKKKNAMAAKMTKEQLDLAAFMKNYLGKALDYLVATEALEHGRKDYIPHMGRSFLEGWKDEGLKSAVKGLFESYRQDQEILNILAGKTSKILPMEKFFAPTQRRTGQLTPSKNVHMVFLAYAQMFEKKKALDVLIPKMVIYTQALTPEKKTPLGIEFDTSLRDFVNEYINNKKGRRADFGRKLPQGGKIDVTLNAIMTLTAVLDLGGSIATGAASLVGEQFSNYVMMGGFDYAKGTLRMRTAKGKAILAKNKAFTGRGLWEELTEPGKELQTKLMQTLFGMFHMNTVASSKQFLLGSLTKSEYDSGEISTKRLAEIQLEMGRFRAIGGTASIVGSTSVGRAGMQYKRWAAPILSSTLKDIKAVTTKHKGKERFTSKESREIYRIIGLTSVAMAIGSMGGDEEDTLISKTIAKMYRESMSLIQGLDSSFWLSAPRAMSFLVSLGKNIKQLIKMEEYKSKPGLKGVEGFKRQFTPKLIKQFISKDKKKPRSAKRTPVRIRPVSRKKTRRKRPQKR